MQVLRSFFFILSFFFQMCIKVRRNCEASLSSVWMFTAVSYEVNGGSSRSMKCLGLLECLQLILHGWQADGNLDCLWIFNWRVLGGIWIYYKVFFFFLIDLEGQSGSKEATHSATVLSALCDHSWQGYCVTTTLVLFNRDGNHEHNYSVITTLASNQWILLMTLFLLLIYW